MSAKKIRIAMVAVDLSRTGISTVIMNYCQKIDFTKYQIDLLVGDHVVPEYRSICDSLGIKIIELPFKLENARGFYWGLFNELSSSKYDIVHVHGNSAMITPELMIAKIKGIKVRIAHSHNTTCEHVRVDKLLRPIFSTVYTHGFACSEDAGKWLFRDKKFFIIPNGFDTEKFKFSCEKRCFERRKLNVDDKFVVGHIGQFNAQKNHRFLLKVFEEICNSRKDAVLLLVGNGPDKEEISKLIDTHPYKDKIIMYGETDHPEDLYCAMDRFVFPSKFEGLGIVLLEAQINGLACVSSDVVPKEAVISDNATFLSLNEHPQKWAHEILTSREIDRESYFSLNKKQIDRYCITSNAKELMKIYEEFIKDAK